MRSTTALVTTCLLASGLTAAGFAGPASAAGASPSFHPYVAHPTASWPESVATGDVTGDGRPDVVMTTGYYFAPEADFGLWVFPQQPDGSLGEPTRLQTHATYGSSMAVAVADLDGDTDDDVAVTTDEGVEIYAQGADGLAYSWTVPLSDAQHAEAVDVSGDGHADLIVSSAGGIKVWWQINGDFMPSPAGAVLSTGGATEIEVGDVTGDGLADVVSAQGPLIEVRRQRPDHSFEAPVTYHSGGLDGWEGVNGIAVGDVDDDGLLDVVASVGGNKPNAWMVTRLQQPDGALGPAVRRTSYDIPESIEVADVTADGRDDVVVVHGGWSRVGVFVQDLPGTMASAEELFPVPYASHYHPKGLAVGDVTGDGRPDVALADYNHGLVLLRGAAPAADTWSPETTITSGPSGTHRSRTAVVSFAADEPATFECALDTLAAWRPCTSPVTYDGLSAGAHTVHVRATDLAGNTDLTPAARSFTVDGPDTFLTSGPTGQIRATAATFAFSGGTGATGFECALDNSAWAACSSPATYTGLRTGTAHQFRVRAVGADGLVDSMPATRVFGVEAAADLAVTLTGTPDPVRKGGTLTHTLTVANSGPDAAASTVSSLGLPVGLVLGQVSTTVGSCDPSGSPAMVRCDFGTLAPGASAVVTLRSTVTAARGSLAATAVASTPTWDLSGANDSASVSTHISNGKR